MVEASFYIIQTFQCIYLKMLNSDHGLGVNSDRAGGYTSCTVKLI